MPRNPGKITGMENFRLKVFRAVAKHLNFRRAAEELCLTQPAVTLQIKALEQDLGVQLFDRSGAHITLTPAGAMLLKYAGKIEKLEAATLAALAPFSEGQRGELRIGASLTIAQYILPHLLGSVPAAAPSGAAVRHHLQYGASAGSVGGAPGVGGVHRRPDHAPGCADRSFSGR